MQLAPRVRLSPACAQAELALAEEARAELRRVLMAEQAVREAREAEVRREAERKVRAFWMWVRGS